LQRAEAQTKLKSAAILVARQRPNPEIESRVLFGIADHPSDVLSETNFYHPLELGGKRAARIHKAGAALDLAQSESLEIADEAILETVIRLHRLRQIRVEYSMLREVLSTYRKTVALYRGRPLLSPEQETSLLVFDSALQEGALKKIELDNENSRLRADLLASLGYETGFSETWIPGPPRDWPEISFESMNWEQWATLQKARAKVKDARASFRVAKSEVWPTVRLGPSLETDSPLGGPQAAVGFALSTELPFYHRNKGKKAEARQEESLANLNLELLERRARIEAQRLNQEYRSNLQAFRKVRAAFNFSRGHEALEARFERGLIPSNLLLEAHRQMLELTEQTHRTELKAIEALWRIFALEGRIRQEKI
jgi:Outer membrane protein